MLDIYRISHIWFDFVTNGELVIDFQMAFGEDPLNVRMCNL
jgi:hypothetical protein